MAVTGGCGFAIRIFQHVVVKNLPIMCCDVFDVGQVFEPSFNFKGGDACIYHGPNMLGGVEVFEGEEMLVFSENFAAIGEVVCGTTGLAAASSVARAAVEVLAEVALAAVGYAERAVNESLEFHVGGFADFLHLLKAGLAGEDYATETDFFEEADPPRVNVVGLCAGMERDWGEFGFQETKVLEYDGICADEVKLMDELVGGLNLSVEEKGVDSYKHFGTI